MSSERMLAPPISTVGTMISTMAATKRDCELMRLLSSPWDQEYGATWRNRPHLLGLIHPAAEKRSSRKPRGSLGGVAGLLRWWGLGWWYYT